jgi:hypothetical protein
MEGILRRNHAESGNIGGYERSLNRMIKNGGSADAQGSMLLVGPWPHESTSNFSDADFGKEAAFLKKFRMIVLWFNCRLSGRIFNEFPMRLIYIFIVKSTLLVYKKI